MKHVRYLGVSSLRVLKAASLRALGEDLIAVTVHGRPVAVIVSFEHFLKMQDALQLAAPIERIPICPTCHHRMDGNGGCCTARDGACRCACPDELAKKSRENADRSRAGDSA